MTALAMTTGSAGIWKRVQTYKPSKAAALLFCIATMAVTIAVGFTWGGWITSETAAAMGDRAAMSGQMKLAATICADRFITGPHAREQTIQLRKADSGQRADYLRQGGWLTLPGLMEPITGSAKLCAEQIFASSPS